MELNEAISKRIKMLCYDQGISIEHFVTKVNADPQAVIAVVNGNGHFAPLGVMGAICIALGISMTEFYNHPMFKGL